MDFWGGNSGAIAGSDWDVTGIWAHFVTGGSVSHSCGNAGIASCIFPGRPLSDTATTKP